MGKHESSRAKSHIWLTPRSMIDALGGWRSFDLDPCAAPPPQPWRTAATMNAREDANGLLIEWSGRVWLNPPYDRGTIGSWLARMASHDRGTALLAARTDNEAWHEHVWPRASGLLFLRGRVNFHLPNGRRSEANPGHASVLVAYGAEDLDRLAASGLSGALVDRRQIERGGTACQHENLLDL